MAWLSLGSVFHKNTTDMSGPRKGGQSSESRAKAPGKKKKAKRKMSMKFFQKIYPLTGFGRITKWFYPPVKSHGSFDIYKYWDNLNDLQIIVMAPLSNL